LLMGALMLSYLRADAKNAEDLEVLSFTHDHLEKIQNFAKKDLGLFNWEWARVHKALSLQKILSQPEEFVRKGHRRKQGIILSEAFPLAVDLAYIDAV